MEILRRGDTVSVRVSNPRYGWGKVTKKSIGVLVRRHPGGWYIVRFPENKNFHAAPGELKKVPFTRSIPEPIVPNPRAIII